MPPHVLERTQYNIPFLLSYCFKIKYRSQDKSNQAGHSSTENSLLEFWSLDCPDAEKSVPGTVLRAL